jgi:glutamate racemase
MNKIRPIGIFDSGVGGLTVVKEFMKIMPNENIVYFGDTARVPYGSKSQETVTKFAIQDVNFLKSKDVKAVVIACNTASATSLDALVEKFDVPIIGVIESGAQMAVNVTKNKKVGIIGTESTIASGAYSKMIKKLDSEVQVYPKACSLFVPIVEDGWVDTDVAYMVAEKYLNEIKSNGVDTIVMGCTHYPLLYNVIKKVMGDKVFLVNPAEKTAEAVKKILSDSGLRAENDNVAECKYYASDYIQKFESIGTKFLNRNVTCVQKVNIEEY